jgi:hypothetical protein
VFSKTSKYPKLLKVYLQCIHIRAGIYVEEKADKRQKNKRFITRQPKLKINYDRSKNPLRKPFNKTGIKIRPWGILLCTIEFYLNGEKKKENRKL